MLEITGGSITGTDHVKAGQPGSVNNHDAYAWDFLENNGVVSVVCDGCSTGKHSEVGAKIASKIIIKILKDELSSIDNSLGLNGLNWQRIKQLILGQLSTIAYSMGGSLSKTVNDYFLFTVIGTIITESEVLVFNCGDGVYILNDEVHEIGPFSDNAPPYFMYNLVGSSLIKSDSVLLDFQHEMLISRSGVESLIIGTDGLMDLVQIEGRLLPSNLSQEVKPVSHFLEKKFFKNSDMVNRTLRIINREFVESNKIRSGLLRDDTTLVVIKM